MGTCTHVIVTNTKTGYVSLCHADSSTNLKNEQSGLPAWIRKACPDSDYDSIIIDVGPNEDNMHYISQVRDVLSAFGISDKLTIDNSVADIAVSRDGAIKNNIGNEESFAEEVTIISPDHRLRGHLINERDRNDRRQTRLDENFIENNYPPICIFNGSSSEFIPMAEIMREHSEIDWDSLERNSNTSSESGRESDSDSKNYSNDFEPESSEDDIPEILEGTDIQGSSHLVRSEDYIPEILENADIHDSNHLVRSEKGVLSELKKERQFMDLLTRDLTTQEKIILQDIQKNMEPPSIASGESVSSIAKFFVALIPEDNHQIDHKQNITQLSKMLEEGVIKANTVICLERKEEGNNFGMNDVKLLAAILMHNAKNEHSLPISESIELSAIYQDAVLYNKAKACGVDVIGIEKKGLQLNKTSSNYEKERESYMADRINQLTAGGKNVILPIGSSHISGLKPQLEGSIIVLDKSKVENLQVTAVVSNIRDSLQEAAASSVSQVTPIPQNKKRLQRVKCSLA